MEVFNDIDFINKLSECEVFSKIFSRDDLITDLFIFLDDIDDCDVDKVSSIIDKISRKIQLSRDELGYLYPIFIKTDIYDLIFLCFINVYFGKCYLNHIEKINVDNVDLVSNLDDIKILKNFFNILFRKFFDKYTDRMISTSLLKDTRKNILDILNFT